MGVSVLLFSCFESRFSRGGAFYRARVCACMKAVILFRQMGGIILLWKLYSEVALICVAVVILFCFLFWVVLGFLWWVGFCCCYCFVSCFWVFVGGGRFGEYSFFFFFLFFFFF